MSETEIYKGSAEILDGAVVAERIKGEVANSAVLLKQNAGVQPRLVAVRVGEDPASAVYVGNKVRTSQELGLGSELIALPASTTTAELLEVVRLLNERDDVDGILVQLPLPAHTDERLVLEAIDPAKDVDGFHPLNVGRLALGQPALVSCTPLGVIELLDHYGVQLKGANVCVVGRSNIVGKPLAQLLLRRDATVTICHSRTRDLPAVTKGADILIAAIGRAGILNQQHIRPGATVIDVGINRVSDPEVAQSLFGDDLERRLAVIAKRGFTITGDVNPRDAAAIAGRVTPVPGGVGLLTVAMLMKNTLEAAMRRRGLL
jgi:methylenetetrahydrofolate dehydrogenase (NADP+)/methenyltetrahydrofolate cyclohydrolase